MKLKEAQTLGIIALIAVCIILLSRWGGGDDVSEMYRRMQDTEAAENGVAENTNNAAERAGNNLDSTPNPDVGPTEVNVMNNMTENIGPDPDEALNNHAEENGDSPGADFVTPAGTVDPPKPVFHVVAKGETLGAISRKYYGTSTKWRDIMAANKTIVKDERLLRPGMRLRIPAPPEAPSGETASAADAVNASAHALAARANVKYYTVSKGDSLYDIALRVYGNGMDYKKILAANAHMIRNADEIRPGMKLVIP